MKVSSYIPGIFCHHQYFPDWNYEVKDGCRKNKWNENIEKMVSTLWKWLKQFSCHVVELFSFYGLSQWLQFALTFIHAQFCYYDHFSTSHIRNCKKVIVKRFCRSCQRVNWFGQHPNFSFSSACCTFCSMIIILLEGRVSTIIGGLVLPLHLAQFFRGIFLLSWHTSQHFLHCWRKTTVKVLLHLFAFIHMNSINFLSDFKSETYSCIFSKNRLAKEPVQMAFAVIFPHPQFAGP